MLRNQSSRLGRADIDGEGLYCDLVPVALEAGRSCDIVGALAVDAGASGFVAGPQAGTRSNGGWRNLQVVRGRGAGRLSWANRRAVRPTWLF